MKLPFSIPVFALALGLGASVAAFAQVTQTQSQAPVSAGTGTHHHRNVMNEALAELQLSADQQSKLDSLRSAYHAKEKGVTDPDQRRADAKQFRSDVMAVLTPDQVAQLQANMKTLRAQARASRAAMPSASPTP
jgi:Spy/CpxP family protein refolding chaperone